MAVMDSLFQEGLDELVEIALKRKQASIAIDKI